LSCGCGVRSWDSRAQGRINLPPAPKDANAALAILINNFPQIRPESVRFAVETTLKIGVEGLANMDAKAASALALGAARIAVRSAEGRMLGFPMPRRDTNNVVHIVQDWSFVTENSPFQVQEYPEQIDLIKCVASLALDAHACVHLAAQLPGGCMAPGYTMWEEADETFGYALLSGASGKWQ
jgi:hypothetical protein